MPLKKIGEVDKIFCLDPEHKPPMHHVYPPGVYEYTCPSCGFKTIFTIPRVSMGSEAWVKNDTRTI